MKLGEAAMEHGSMLMAADDIVGKSFGHPHPMEDSINPCSDGGVPDCLQHVLTENTFCLNPYSTGGVPDE